MPPTQKFRETPRTSPSTRQPPGEFRRRIEQFTAADGRTDRNHRACVTALTDPPFCADVCWSPIKTLAAQIWAFGVPASEMRGQLDDRDVRVCAAGRATLAGAQLCSGRGGQPGGGMAGRRRRSAAVSSPVEPVAVGQPGAVTGAGHRALSRHVGDRGPLRRVRRVVEIGQPQPQRVAAQRPVQDHLGEQLLQRHLRPQRQVGPEPPVVCDRSMVTSPKSADATSSSSTSQDRARLPPAKRGKSTLDNALLGREVLLVGAPRLYDFTPART